MNSDKVRFERAQRLVNAEYADKKKRLEALDDAIRALQSTDDSGFVEYHDSLLKEARRLKDEIAQEQGKG